MSFCVGNWGKWMTLILIDKNSGELHPKKLAIELGESEFYGSATLKSHCFDVGLESHTLRLQW
uniref:Uncharacterized protein n=1 Tax=Rhizophora mucronata TaxID=61149 RepID=A0A2P2NSM5_RHIMU